MDSINWHSFFFYLFGLVSCVFAIGMVVSSNIVRMAFYLILSLGATAGLFFLADAPFVGVMQLLIYVGGTLVLLVFGVMLTAQGPFVSLKTRGGEWVLGAIVGGALLAVLLQAAFSIDDWRARDSRSLAYASGVTRAAAGESARVIFRARQLGGDGAGRWVVLTTEAEATAGAAQPAEGSREIRIPISEGQTAADFVRRFEHPLVTAELPPGSRGAGRVTSGDSARLAMRGPRLDSKATLIGLALLGARPDAAVAVDSPATVGAVAAETDHVPGVSPATGTSGSGYLLPFEIISVHLLVVLIGAAYLARTKRRVGAAVPGAPLASRT